jgi:chromosome segregation ATPase
MSDLKSKKPAELRDIANGLGIVGRFQMKKEELIVAIETTLAEKTAHKKSSKNEPKPKVNPLELCDEDIRSIKEELKTARTNYFKLAKTAESVQQSRDEIHAIENRLKAAKAFRKEVRAEIKAAARENRKFDWKTFLTYVLATGVGVAIPVGVSVLMDTLKTSEVEAVNGDDL